MRAAVNGSISFALETGEHVDAVAIGHERTILPSLRLAGRQSPRSSKSNDRVRWRRIIIKRGDDVGRRISIRV